MATTIPLSGVQYSGKWTLQSQAQAVAASTWPALSTKLYLFGRNNFGQLGLGNITDYSSPKQLASTTAWSNAALGQGYTVAQKTDGTLWAWGNNQYGQLGLGNITYYSSPKQVGSVTTWTTLKANASNNSQFVLALRSDGTLWGTGRNFYGNLGNSDRTNVSSFTQVGALTTWSKIALGFGFVAAIKTNGTLWAWGYNGYGQLGLGNTTDYSSPVQVGSLTNWLNVATNYYSTAAVKTDGTLWTWGMNSVGQLGLNSATYAYSSPSQVGSLTTWSKIYGIGQYTFLAIKTDGALWGWGDAQAGQLGDGSQLNKSSPVQIGALTTWQNISGGRTSSIGIRTDGTIWTWGQNTYGQLGLGNTSNYSSPKQVGSLTTWTNVFANGFNSAATVISF
jgi:alpha-tubulin suppressor-like RCC1 family protein